MTDTKTEANNNFDYQDSNASSGGLVINKPAHFAAPAKNTLAAYAQPPRGRGAAPPRPPLRQSMGVDPPQDETKPPEKPARHNPFDNKKHVPQYQQNVRHNPFVDTPDSAVAIAVDNDEQSPDNINQS